MPWSVRQMAIYQKVDEESQQKTCITLQPSTAFMRRMQEWSEQSQLSEDFNSHWTCLHLLALGSVSRNWAAYIMFLEIEIDKIVSADCLVVLTSLTKPSTTQ